MNDPSPLGRRLDAASESWLLDALIRAGLILALAMLCYRIVSPFLMLMIWGVILAVTLYPLQGALARRMGGRAGWAAATITLLGVTLIVAPTALLMNSVGDTVRALVEGVQQNTLRIPQPRPGVADWPIVGERLFSFWTAAHDDLPALIQRLQPKIGTLAKDLLGLVAAIGGAVLGFVAAFVVAGVLMAFGEPGARASRAVFSRAAGTERGERFSALSVATIRAVALGVVGIAFIQAIAVGLCLLAAGIPLAGLLALVVLVLGVAQVPALIVTLPVIAYLWASGAYGTAEAAILSALLFVAGMADNVLKPLMLGRGVDAPMPVILLGALGGMAAAGIVGLFVGATLLALGHQLFMGWVASNPRANQGPDVREATPP